MYENSLLKKSEDKELFPKVLRTQKIKIQKHTHRHFKTN